MNSTRKRLLGFLTGVTIAVVLAILPKRVVDSFGWFGEVVFIAAVLVFLAGLRAFYRRANDEAVPAKKSDWIGYGVIGAFCLGVGLVAWRVLRE